MTFRFSLIALVLAGCGGADFDSLFGDAPPLPTVASMPGTGGHVTERATGSGGSISSGGFGGSISSSIAGSGFGSGGNPEDACVLVMHSNGAGQLWHDCVPLYTWSSDQALKACSAWCVVNGGCSCNLGTACGDDIERVYTRSDEFFMSWEWQGPYTGNVTQVHLKDPQQPTPITCVTVDAWN